MEDSKIPKRFTHGILYSLQKLEDMTHGALDEKENIAKQRRQLATLHKTLQQLVQQQERLLYKLQRGPSKVLSDLLQDEDAEIEVISEAQHAAVTSSVAFAKRLKALEFLQAYRLSGVTASSVNDRRVRLRWDTFYHGEYYEPYYMELEFKGHMQVFRHTLPYFLPVANVAEVYLNKDLAYFVDELGDLLNAYVSRRQQVVQLKKDHRNCVVGDVSCSQSLDYVQFSFLFSDRRSSQLDIELFYDSLHTTLPTKAHLTCDDTVETDTSRVKKIELLLKQHELSKALSLAVDGQHSAS